MIKVSLIIPSACIIMVACSCSNNGKVPIGDHDISDHDLLESTWNGDPDIAIELSYLYNDKNDKMREFKWARMAGESYESMRGVKVWVDCIVGADWLPAQLQDVVYGGIAQSEKEAIEIIYGQASRKHVRASLLLGEYLYEGLKLKCSFINDGEEYAKVLIADPDYEKAIRWYEDASNRGMVSAWYCLSEIVSWCETENNLSISLYWVAMVHAIDQEDWYVPEGFAEGVREELGKEIREDIAKQVVQKIDMICDDKWNVLDSDGNRIAEPIEDRAIAKQRALKACGIIRLR